MPDPAAPDAAVQIVIRAINMRCDGPLNAQNVLAALDRGGWLHDPAELDAARARLASAVAPMQRLRELLTLHSRDWAPDRRDALLWALLVGWECEGKCTEADDPEHTCDAALREVAERHQWPPQFVDGVRQHRAALAHVSR